MQRCKQLAGAVLLLAGIGGSAQVLAHGGMMDDAHGAEREVLRSKGPGVSPAIASGSAAPSRSA